MKVKNLSLILGLLLFIFALSSCTIDKRVHLPGYHVEWHGTKHKTDLIVKNNPANISENIEKISERESIAVTSETSVSTQAVITEDYVSETARTSRVVTSKKEKTNLKSDQKTNLTVNSSNQSQSSFRAEFREGYKAIMTVDADQPLQTNGLGVAGFVSSLVGLFIFGIVLGAMAVIFCAIALGQINKQPGKWKGKGLVIAGLVIGLLDIIIVLVLVSML